MGDLVDITTVPKQENIYYKLTSGSLRFQVKGRGNAGIGFTNKPNHVCDLWIVLGWQDCTVVKKEDEQVRLVATPGILSTAEFREFWLHWHDDLICLGRDDAEKPFLTYQDSFHFKYLTFAAVDSNSTTLQWRFEMPPMPVLRDTSRLKPISAGFPQWIQAEDQLPDCALIGGFEKEMLYIIRAHHVGSLTPGKFVPSQGVGFVPWGGQMHEKTEFEILVGYDCIWVPCNNGSVPIGAVEAGYSEVNHEPLFVGRALCKGHLIPGKVQASHNVCYIPLEEMEIPVNEYEVLVEPHKNIQCMNPFFKYDLNICPSPILDLNIENLVDDEDEILD